MDKVSELNSIIGLLRQAHGSRGHHRLDIKRAALRGKESFPRRGSGRMMARTGLRMMPTFPSSYPTVGELTSNGHLLTSQGGSVVEEGWDKDQYIKNDLLPEAQTFEELPTKILDRFHNQR